MMNEEKSVSYTTTNTYQTLNTLNDQTKNIWIVCHGLGHLSSFFIKHFKSLAPDTNYIIAPQAPSKYYQDKRYKYIGASWLTRENTKLEIENLLNYLDQVYKKELSSVDLEKYTVVLMGFSQGVSVITRWLAHREIPCDVLILHSGKIPADVKHIANQPKRVFSIYGNEDSLISKEALRQQHQLAKSLFDSSMEDVIFDGAHVVHEASLQQIATTVLNKL